MQRTEIKEQIFTVQACRGKASAQTQAVFHP